MTTTYALMTAQTVPNNAPDGVLPVPVAVPGSPTRGRFTFSLSGPATMYAEATVLASTPGVYNTPFESRIYIPILTMNILPGSPNSISQELRFGAPYDSFEVVLNTIARDGQTAASLTLVV